MAGTREGGLKAAKTNIENNGSDFYSRIGKIGGRNGHTGGFASNPEMAKIAGMKGGRISKRLLNAEEKAPIEERRKEFEKEFGLEFKAGYNLAKTYND